MWFCSLDFLPEFIVIYFSGYPVLCTSLQSHMWQNSQPRFLFAAFFFVMDFLAIHLLRAEGVKTWGPHQGLFRSGVPHTQPWSLALCVLLYQPQRAIQGTPARCWSLGRFRHFCGVRAVEQRIGVLHLPRWGGYQQPYSEPRGQPAAFDILHRVYSRSHVSTKWNKDWAIHRPRAWALWIVSPGAQAGYTICHFRYLCGARGHGVEPRLHSHHWGWAAAGLCNI